MRWKSIVWTVVIMVILFAPVYVVPRLTDPLLTKLFGLVYLLICGALILWAVNSDLNQDNDDD